MLQNTIGEILGRNSANLSFGYSKVAKLPKIAFKNIVRIGFKLHPFLFLKLGRQPSYKNETIFQGKNSFEIFKYNANIDAGYNNLYIHSDVAEHTIEGDTLAPILRVLPFEPSASIRNIDDCQHINDEIMIPHYIPV